MDTISATHLHGGIRTICSDARHLAGLRDRRAPKRQTWGDLPCQEVQGHVPRGDQGKDALGRAMLIREDVGVGPPGMGFLMQDVRGKVAASHC